MIAQCKQPAFVQVLMDPASAIAIFALLLRDISYKYNECVSFLTGDISLSGPSPGMCNVSFVIDLVFRLRFLAASKGKFIIFMVSHPAKIEDSHGSYRTCCSGLILFCLMTCQPLYSIKPGLN